LIKEVATLITRRKDIGMIRFGQKIKKIRTDAGFSQAYLAELIGVSAQSVSNWECDNTMPDISQIVPLAGA
jgi:transcriptional regulator with XRE-family HTH domain